MRELWTGRSPTIKLKVMSTLQSPKSLSDVLPLDLSRKSTIKTSLQRGCLNETLRREIQQAVLRSRNLAHVGSPFANFAIVNRLQSWQSVPPLDHTFFTTCSAS
jgi:hypothetical protein